MCVVVAAALLSLSLRHSVFQIRVLPATTDNTRAPEQQREEEKKCAKQQAEERGNITMGGTTVPTAIIESSSPPATLSKANILHAVESIGETQSVSDDLDNAQDFQDSDEDLVEMEKSLVAVTGARHAHPGSIRFGPCPSSIHGGTPWLGHGCSISNTFGFQHRRR